MAARYKIAMHRRKWLVSNQVTAPPSYLFTALEIPKSCSINEALQIHQSSKETVRFRVIFVNGIEKVLN